MADLNKPSIIEDAPELPEKDATPEEHAPQVEENVPAREEMYVPLLPGESLADLAARYNTTVEKVVERNKCNPDYIHPWQWFFV